MKVLKKIEYYSNLYPNRTAISINSDISYSKFWQLALNLSSYLCKKNIEIVCILQDDKNDFSCYVAMIATLISGKTYVPVNKNTPLNRLKLILKSSKANVIISNKKLKTKIHCKSISLIDILNLKKIKNFKVKNSTKDAYIIFTSGSTGNPKGVRISRKSLDHYISWISKSFFKNKYIKCSQHPGIGFDLSVADIYGTLCSGGTLFPIQRDYDRLFLNKFIKKNNITHWVSVPSVVDLIFNDNFFEKKDTLSLKKMFFCGETLKKIHLQKIFNANNKIQVMNAYGPTEATVSCTSINLNNNNYKKFCKPSASFGKTIKNMKINFLNNQKNQGEIIISGPQVSEGYLDDFNLNKKKFFKKGNNKIFVTGDVCKKINGNFYFLNRLDRQVKILGNRIELDEIDSIVGDITKLTSHTLIDNNKIYTFLNGSFNKNFMINRLKKYLPKYMLPNEIIEINKFPKNSNQKIDEKKLINFIKWKKN